MSQSLLCDKADNDAANHHLYRKSGDGLGLPAAQKPSRVHSFEQVVGKGYVFYPETSPERCTAALLLEIDPIGLVRNRRGASGEAHMLEQHVNDWPYAASSFLSVAIARTFGTAILNINWRD